MKRLTSVLPCIVLLLCGCRGETEAEIADRVLKRRELFNSVAGCEIVSMSEESYRTTVIVLSDGRKIAIESGKHWHKTKVLDESSQ